MAGPARNGRPPGLAPKEDLSRLPPPNRGFCVTVPPLIFFPRQPSSDSCGYLAHTRFSYYSLNSTFSYFAKKSTQRPAPSPKHQTILPLPRQCVLSSSWATVAGPRCSAPPPKNRPLWISARILATIR